MCRAPGASGFWRPRQEDPQLEAILAYKVRPSLKKRKPGTWTREYWEEGTQTKSAAHAKAWKPEGQREGRR